MTTKRPPRPPADLAERGRKFWSDTLRVFDLERDELELLREICRVMDELEALAESVAAAGPVLPGEDGPKAHPALSHLRADRGLLGRLLAQLGLPDDAGGSLPSARTVRARKAAASRWQRERERQEARRGAPTA